MKTIVAIAILGMLTAATAFGQSGPALIMQSPEAQPALTGWKIVREEVITPLSGQNEVIVIIAKTTSTNADICASPAGCRYEAHFTTNAELSAYGSARESSIANEPTGTTLAQREARRQARLVNLVLGSCATLTVSPCPSQVSTSTLQTQ
jgi:hypothetical protein